MALTTISTSHFGRSALEGMYSAGASVTSAASGLMDYTTTKPVDISPILEEAMDYDYKFLVGTNTKPYEFWNGIKVNWVVKDEAATMNHFWNEDTLNPIGEKSMDYVQELTDALVKGVDKGWITDEEAKAEYRNAFTTVRNADYKAEQKAQQIKNLKKALAEAEGSGEAGE